MGVTNTKTVPPAFPSEEQTITLGDGLTEELTLKEHTWIKFNGRTIALMASLVSSDPNTDAVLHVNNRVGFNDTFTSIEVNIGESFTVYDVKFVLKEVQANLGAVKYDVMKATKSAPVDLQLNTTSQFNFETVFIYQHEFHYYITLGSIGEGRRVDFFIWNERQVVESLSFRSNKWCKVGDFVFNLQTSTNDTASLFIKEQTTRDTPFGDITLSFDEIVRFQDGESTMTMQVVKMGLLHPRHFDLWCVLYRPNQNQFTEYLSDMTDEKKAQFAVTYAISCKSVELPADSAPQYKLTVNAVDSPEVNLDEEFTLVTNKFVTVKGADLKIRFDYFSNKRTAYGDVKLIKLTTVLNEKQKEELYRVSKFGTATIEMGEFTCKLISSMYDQSATLIVSKQEEGTRDKEMPQSDSDFVPKPKFPSLLDVLKKNQLK